MSMYKRIYGCPDNSTRNESGNSLNGVSANENYFGSGMQRKFKDNDPSKLNQNIDIKENNFVYNDSEWDEYFEAYFNTNK